MTKPEQNACLSTFESKPFRSSSSPRTSPITPFSPITSAPASPEALPIMNNESNMQRQSQWRAQAQVQMRLPVLVDGERRAAGERHSSSSSPNSSRARPDYLLVSCLVLIYLELSWLILMLLRTYSRH